MQNMLMLSLRLMSRFAIVQGKSIKPVPLQTNYGEILRTFHLENQKGNQIDAYFSLLEMPSEEFKNKVKSISSSNFAQSEKSNKVTEFTKLNIAKRYSQMDDSSQQAIDNFYYFVTKSFLELTLVEIDRNNVKQQLVSMLQTINQLFPLVTLTKQNYMNYLYCMKLVTQFSKYFTPSQYLNNYRVSCDCLLETPIQSFSLSQLLQLLKIFTKSNLIISYYEKSNDIANFIYRALPQNWEYNYDIRIQILDGLSRLGFYSQKILDQLENWFVKETNSNHFFMSAVLTYMVKFKRITSDNYKQKLNTNNFKALLKDNVRERQKTFFSKTYVHFINGGIYDTDYWIEFLNFIQNITQTQSRIFQRYHLSCFVRMLQIDKQLIQPKLHEAFEKFKKTKSFQQNLTQKNTMADFLSKQVIQSKGLSCQIQLANSLRLIHVGNLRSQVMIEMFVVDIIIDNKFVIQVNGSTHYNKNLDTGEKHRNLKTEFREKVLKKLGYQYLEIDLEDFSEGSFEIIQQVYKRIKNESQGQQKGGIDI